jgi:hypothetical protein
MVGGAAGVLIGTGFMSWYPDKYAYDVKNTVVKANLGLQYFFRNVKGPVLWAALAATTFSGTECIFEQMRDETHAATYVNAAAAGACTGLVLGSMSKRFDVMCTTALGLGMLMGMIECNGTRFVSDKEGAVKKWFGAQPPRPVESTTVAELKEKYPEFKDL